MSWSVRPSHFIFIVNKLLNNMYHVADLLPILFYLIYTTVLMTRLLCSKKSSEKGSAAVLPRLQLEELSYAFYITLKV